MVHMDQTESPIHSIQSVNSPGLNKDVTGWGSDNDLSASIHSDEIENEIESELSAMDSTLSDSEKTKVRRHSSEKHHRNSDVNDLLRNTPTVNSALKINGKSSGMKLISTKKTRGSPTPDQLLDDLVDMTRKMNENDLKDTWDSSNNWNSDWSKNATNESKRHSTKSKNTRKATLEHRTSHKVTPKALGAEFDIMSLEIKTGGAREEFDFFADMKPDIKPVDIKSEETQSESKKPSSLFDATETWDEVFLYTLTVCLVFKY